LELKFRIKFETDSKKGSLDIIAVADLKAVKLDSKDIGKIEPAYFSIPGDLYEEQDVASLYHPCGGSIGFYVHGKDGIRRSIEDIFYYDYNLGKTHFNGKPHWNHERRYCDGSKTWRTKNVESHQIPDSASINIMMLDSKGNVIKRKTIKRVPPKKVRSK